MKGQVSRVIATSDKASSYTLASKAYVLHQDPI